MSAPADPDRRRLRALLLGGIAVALVGLVLVLLWAKGRKEEAEREREAAREAARLAEEARKAEEKRHVRVRGAEDQLVPGTIVDVGQDPENPIEVSWHPEQGVLVLPEGGGEFRVRVVMPGHRVAHYPAVRGGQIIRMRQGYVVKVPLRGVPESGLPENVRFLLRVQPRGTPIQGLSPQEIVDLMGNLGGPGSGPDHIPRGQFGYPVSREQAEAGIVLPAGGTYHVRWGVVDVKQKTWQGLDDSTGREFSVAEQDEEQTAPLDVTVEKLQSTLDKLAEGVEAAEEHRKRAEEAARKAAQAAEGK